MTPATFWSSVSANLDHYGNAYVWVQQDFTRQKYGGSVKAKGLWIMPSNQVNLLVDDAGIFGTDGGLYYWYQATPGTAISLTRTPCCTLRISLHSMGTVGPLYWSCCGPP